MTTRKINPKVDWFFNKASTWQKEYEKLRLIALDCGLIEELKWGCPCYTFEKKNIVLIHGFKEYCALLFFKGALLKDTKSILIQQTENVQAARQIRCTSLQQIVKMEKTLKAYIYEAIEVEKAGLQMKYKKTAAFTMPNEFQTTLNKNPALKSAFYALTPDGNEDIFFIFLHPSNPKPATPGLKNICGTYSKERDWKINHEE